MSSCDRHIVCGTGSKGSPRHNQGSTRSRSSQVYFLHFSFYAHNCRVRCLNGLTVSLLFFSGLVITDDLLFPLHSSTNIAATSYHISDKMTSPWPSPRLAGEDAYYLHDILLTCGMKNNSACGKIVTIHDVPNTISLKDLQKKIQDKVPNCSIRAGLFWLPKRGKQGRALENERDFSKAKDEYTNANGEVKDLHLAVCMFDMPGNQINK